MTVPAVARKARWLAPRVCVGCGHPFKPKRRAQEACNRSCAQRAVARRRALWAIQAVENSDNSANARNGRYAPTGGRENAGENAAAARACEPHNAQAPATGAPAARIAGYFRLWRDDPRFGCGWRAFIVFDAGRRRARLCEPISGAVATIYATELRQARPIAAPRWQHIRSQIKCARRAARSHGRRIAEKTLKRIDAAIAGGGISAAVSAVGGQS